MNNPRRSTLRGIKQGSPAAQPLRQRRDEEKYWMQRVLTSAASGLLSFQLTQRRCGRNINGGGIIFPIAERDRARGELNQQLSSKPNPPVCISYALFSNSCIMEAFGFKVSSLFGCRQRRERARGLTDENLNSGLRFKCGEEKLRLEVSFPPRFSIASDKQPVQVTELESSSKDKHYR